MRTRRAEPTGDIVKMMCNLSRTVSMKNCQTASFASLLPASFAFALVSPMMRSISSLGKRLGTSPAFKILLISSRNVSLMI